MFMILYLPSVLDAVPMADPSRYILTPARELPWSSLILPVSFPVDPAKIFVDNIIKHRIKKNECFFVG